MGKTEGSKRLLKTTSPTSKRCFPSASRITRWPPGSFLKRCGKNCHPSGRCVTIYHPCLQTKELIQKTGDKIKSIPGGALIADSSNELKELQVLLLEVAEYFLSFAHVENEEDEGLAKAAKRFLLARRDLKSAIERWSI